LIASVDDALRTDRQAAFTREFCKDFNATQAAIRAGYSEAAAHVQGSRLLANAKVRGAIERRLEQIAAVAEVDAAMVVRELLDVATADPRELVSVHRDCCRHCHGIDHRRQWTKGEFEAALVEALAAGQPAPDMAGGIGYVGTREPNPDCSECWGRGVETVLVKDTRTLSPQAAKLYAGAQQTKDGVKALGRNQNEALMALGRYLGMFKDRQELSGPNGAPLQLQPVPASTLTNEQLEAILRRAGHPALQGHPLGEPIEQHQIEAIIRSGK